MKVIISTSKNKDLFFAGHTEELTGKGLGSGALTGMSRVPMFTNDKTKAKQLESWADAKRITAEIIDAIRYQEIEKPDFITVHFLE